MRQAAIAFQSKKLTLEGIITTPQGVPEPYPAILVCHPHPMLGGNMDHPVVTAICGAADREGIATLRFNFRGVGSSEGSFSNGKDEQNDAKVALSILKHWPSIDKKKLAMVGYSFGASVLLNGLKHYKDAKSLALIAPPISSVEGSRIKNDKRPKLFIVGQRDKVAPSVDLQSAIDDMRQPVQFREVPEVDHSLGTQIEAVAEQVAQFVADAMPQ